jgi:hypothetical protein
MRVIGDIEIAAAVLAAGIIGAAVILGVAVVVAAGRIRKGLEK